MRDHDGCDEAMALAQHTGRYGWAEYLATRCDLRHHDEPDPAANQARAALTTGDNR